MPVVDKGNLIGIICQSDVLKGLKAGSIQDLSVRDVMVENVITAPPTESAVNIAKTMIEKKVNRIPIIDNGKLVGIVTRGDIIKAVAECG